MLFGGRFGDADPFGRRRGSPLPVDVEVAVLDGGHVRSFARGPGSAVDQDDFDGLAEPEPHVLLGVEAGVTQPLLDRPAEELLRQGRPVVGGSGSSPKAITSPVNPAWRSSATNVPPAWPAPMTTTRGIGHASSTRIGSRRRPPTKLVCTTLRPPVISRETSRGS